MTALEYCSLIFVLATAACAGGAATSQQSFVASRTAMSSPGELRGAERDRALRDLQAQEPALFDVDSCQFDDDCQATAFTTCCRPVSVPGVAICEDCDWRARNVLWLRRAMARCNAMECPASLCRPARQAPRAYCAAVEAAGVVRGECRLREK
ncbi:MAG: hypothetical protein AB8H86_10685 [Polyangiales bacterium]